MAILRFAHKPELETLPEVRDLMRRLRESVASHSGEWACWIDRAGERFRVRVQEVGDTGRGFTALATSASLPAIFERFAAGTNRSAPDSSAGVASPEPRTATPSIASEPVTA